MKKNGPWTIKSSEIKYKNTWMEVREDQVIRPDGNDGIYGVISFGEAGTHIVPIDDEGNIYLIKEFAFGTEQFEITVPAGGVEDGETPLEAAKRELREEIGIEASEWISLGYAKPLTTYMNLPIHSYIAKGLKIGKPETEST